MKRRTKSRSLKKSALEMRLEHLHRERTLAHVAINNANNRISHCDKEIKEIEEVLAQRKKETQEGAL